jgi:glycosyltransferase involved in cell wall biosynthesis
MLAQALESVFVQTYRNVEVIVVDDGSTDHTSSTVRKHHGRVVYVRQENQGRASVKNTGIATAQGPYIAFLDDDDIWYPCKLQLQVDLLENNREADLVYGAGYRIDGATRTFLSCEPPSPEPEEVVRWLLDGHWLGISSIMVRAQALRDNGAFDPRYPPCEDWDMWLRMACRGRRFAYIQEPIWEYRFHGGNVVYDNARLHASMVSVLRGFFESPLTPDALRSERNRYLSRRLVELGMDYYIALELAKAWTAWREALALDVSTLSAPLVFLMLKSLSGVRMLGWARRARQAVLCGRVG